MGRRFGWGYELLTENLRGAIMFDENLRDKFDTNMVVIYAKIQNFWLCHVQYCSWFK